MSDYKSSEDDQRKERGHGRRQALSDSSSDREEGEIEDSDSEGHINASGQCLMAGAQWPVHSGQCLVASTLVPVPHGQCPVASV